MCDLPRCIYRMREDDGECGVPEGRVEVKVWEKEEEECIIGPRGLCLLAIEF